MFCCERGNSQVERDNAARAASPAGGHVLQHDYVRNVPLDYGLDSDQRTRFLSLASQRVYAPIEWRERAFEQHEGKATRIAIDREHQAGVFLARHFPAFSVPARSLKPITEWVPEVSRFEISISPAARNRFTPETQCSPIFRMCKAILIWEFSSTIRSWSRCAVTTVVERISSRSMAACAQPSRTKTRPAATPLVIAAGVPTMPTLPRATKCSSTLVSMSELISS